MNIFSFKILSVSLISTITILGSVSASAHHNFVSHYDMKTPEISIEGTVESFWFVNPHVRVYINVPDKDTGENVVWIAEGRSRSILSREGWVGDEIQKGNTITVTGTPARSEKMQRHLLLGNSVNVNGKTLHTGPLDKKVKHFKLGGDDAATSNSHLDEGARDEGIENEKNQPE
jgi:hypothetical protein